MRTVDEPCGDCDGTGRVEAIKPWNHVGRPPDEPTWIELDCDRCKGSGEVQVVLHSCRSCHAEVDENDYEPSQGRCIPCQEALDDERRSTA